MSIPKELNEKGKKFWKKVLKEYDLSEAHDLERLKMACKCLDNLNEAEERVAAEGMFTVNRYGNTTEHPALKTVKDLRLLFIKIIRELGFDLVNMPDSRPPRQY